MFAAYGRKMMTASANDGAPAETDSASDLDLVPDAGRSNARHGAPAGDDGRAREELDAVSRALKPRGIASYPPDRS
jgi:hypothetical protein